MRSRTALTLAELTKAAQDNMNALREEGNEPLRAEFVATGASHRGRDVPQCVRKAHSSAGSALPGPRMTRPRAAYDSPRDGTGRAGPDRGGEITAVIDRPARDVGTQERPPQARIGRIPEP